MELDLDVVFEDEHLLVVDKPAGLVAHPSGPDERVTLAHGLLSLGAAGGDPERPGIVHRLDRDTSGLLVVARSDEALRAALDGDPRAAGRAALPGARPRGAPRSRTGRITAPIGRDRRDRTRHSLDTETPREAVTWFEVQEPLGERTLLEVRLETGRTHQIRVHLEAIELPVCGDPVYGVAGDLGLERQFLHAHRLRLEHPFTGAELDLALAAPGRSRGARSRRGAQPRSRYDSPFRPADPATPPDGGAGALQPGSVRARRRSTIQPKGSHRGSRLHEGAAGGRSALRSPDAPLEPEDEALHLRRARRHLHHRPPADAGAAAGGTRLRAQHRRPRGRRSSSSARRSRRRTRSSARRRASASRTSRNRWLGGLLTNWRTIADRIALPPGAAPAEGGGTARPPAGQGAHRDGRRAARSSSRTSAASRR